MKLIAFRPSTSSSSQDAIISKQLIILYEKYSFADAYIMYRGQRVLIRTFGLTYLDDWSVWSAFGREILIIYFVHTQIPTNQYFFANLDYASIPIYFNPLNFYTRELIQTDNSAFIKAFNNRNFKVFSCGNKILSLVSENVPFNGIERVHAATLSVNNTYYSKLEADGKALFTSSKFLIELPLSFNQIIIYNIKNTQIAPLPTKFRISFTFHTSNFGPQELEFGMPQNSKFFLIQLPSHVNLNFEKGDNLIIEAISPSNAQFIIDTVFCSTLPTIGNQICYNTWTKETSMPYIKIIPSQCDNGRTVNEFNGKQESSNNSQLFVYDMYYALSAQAEYTFEYTHLCPVENYPIKAHFYSVDTLQYLGTDANYSGPLSINSGIGRIIFEWKSTQSFDYFDVPIQSPTAIAFFTSNANFAIQHIRPSPYLPDNTADIVNNNPYFTGYNGLIYASINNFALGNLYAFKRIRTTFKSLTSTCQPALSTVYRKNLDDALEVVDVINGNDLSDTGVSYIDTNAFNLAIRSFPFRGELDMRKYYNFEFFVKCSVQIDIDLSLFKFDSKEQLYICSQTFNLESNTTFPQYSQVSCRILPYYGKDLRQQLVVYMTGTKQVRQTEYPLFIEQANYYSLIFRDITSLSAFTFKINDLVSAKRNIDTNIFSVFLLFK